MTKEWEWSEYGHGILEDFPFKPGETITYVTNFNGNVYVATQHRIFLLERKSRLRKFWERLKKRFAGSKGLS